MAVDTTQFSSIYTVLNANVKVTLDEQYNSRRITGPDYATVVAQAINSMLQTSASLIQNDAQLAQEATLEANRLAQDAPVKEAQASLIAKQEETEIAKKFLTIRQMMAYDDNLRVEEGKQLSNVTGMFGVGGTTLPDGLETNMLNSIAAITPGETSYTTIASMASVLESLQ